MLIRDNYFICGGSIVADRWILTAAHCVKGVSASRLRVRVREHIFNQGGEGEQDFSVDSVKIHKQYDASTLDYDYALLRLSSSLQQVKYEAAAVCMPPAGMKEKTSYECYVSGWGRLEYGGDIPNIDNGKPLQYMEATLWKPGKCRKKSKYPENDLSITKRMICNQDYPKSACNGDSGGPLVCKVDGGNQFYQFGIVSWGVQCGHQDFPGVYARVKVMRAWLCSKSKGEIENVCD